MITALWAIGAVALWWLVSTIKCGGLECLPYMAFFYSSWYLPIIIYAAISERVVRRLSPRWGPVIFLILALVSFALFVVCLRLGPAPFLFSDPERAMSVRNLILWPTGWIVAFYLAKSIWHRYRDPIEAQSS